MVELTISLRVSSCIERLGSTFHSPPVFSRTVESVMRSKPE